MDMNEQVTISELAKRTGVTQRTIRYYVEQGLLPPGVVAGKERLYGYEHFLRIRLIKLLQEEDVPLKKIRAQLDSLSLAEMQELVELGTRMKMQDTPRRPIGPRELLAAVLAPCDKEPVMHDRAAPREPVLLREALPALGRADAPLTPPPEKMWRKIILAPGVELLYEIQPDPKRNEALQALVRFAAQLFSKTGY